MTNQVPLWAYGGSASTQRSKASASASSTIISGVLVLLACFCYVSGVRSFDTKNNETAGPSWQLFPAASAVAANEE